MVVSFVRWTVVFVFVAAAFASERYELPGQWRWTESRSDSGSWFDPKLDDSNWNTVAKSAPDRIAGPAWYRLAFSAPPMTEHSARLILDRGFDDATVWLNGRELWNRERGGDAFETDIAELLRNSQRNVLAVYLERAPAKIHPRAHLLIGPRVFISNQRVLAFPGLNNTGARLTASVWITNASENTAIVEIEARAAPDGGGSTTGLTVSPGTTAAAELHWSIAAWNVHLWDRQHPALYRLSTSLTAVSDSGDTHYRDSDEVAFGIRRIESREGQILVNGNPLPTSWLKAGETTPESLAAADASGLTLIEESHNGRPALRKMIQRDWNHPSIVGWSIQDGTDGDFVKALDNSRVVLTDAAAHDKK